MLAVNGLPRSVPMTAGGDPAFARARIGRVIGADSLLLTGMVDLEIDMVEGRERAVAAYNSIASIDPAGRLGERYAKAHLVPYGEYLPMRDWLEPLGLSRLVAGTLDFIPGPGPLSQDLGPFGRAGMQISPRSRILGGLSTGSPSCGHSCGHLMPAASFSRVPGRP